MQSSTLVAIDDIMEILPRIGEPLAEVEVCACVRVRMGVCVCVILCTCDLFTGLLL